MRSFDDDLQARLQGPLGRTIRAMLAGVTPCDPVAMLVSIVGLVGASVLAAIIPARRDMWIDPMEAMRAE